MRFLSLLTGVCLLSLTAADAASRRTAKLHSNWWFQTNGAAAGVWKRVSLPAHWEAHEGVRFDGIGWYQCDAGRIETPSGSRVLLRFDGAATAAEVFWNGQRLGAHLGAWTPFRFDVTEMVQAGGAINEIRVRLDERVGHNTQGFLPVIAPHFGGIWKDVSLEFVPGIYIDELSMLAAGNPDTQQIELEIPILGGPADSVKPWT